jgi:hypothetical protein
MSQLHHGFIGDVKPVGHLIGEDRDMPSKGIVIELNAYFVTSIQYPQ